MGSRHYSLTRRVGDLNNDLTLALGRFDEALDLLQVWAEAHPDDHLARASLNLIQRCEGGPDDGR